MTSKQKLATRFRQAVSQLGIADLDETPAEVAKSFNKEFRNRGPDIKTLAKLFSDNPDVVDSVTQRVFDKVENCISVSNRHYDTYHAIAKSLGVGSEAQEDAATIVGDFVFFRLDVESRVTAGGIRLTADHGVNRFWHFNSAEAFMQWKEERDHADHTSSGIPYDHKGFFFKQDGRLVMMGMDTTYFRSMMGNWETRDGLKFRPISLMVLARSKSAGVFAAKSLMFSEDHQYFGASPNDDEIKKLLETEKSSAIIQFTQ